MAIAGSGELRGLLGGPPCRSVSALRYAGDDGPRPVRSTEHPWGLPTATEAEIDMVTSDTLLFFRFLALYVIAEEVRDASMPKTQLVVEQPEDPARYRSQQDVEELEFMSIFRTDAWKNFQSAYQLFMVHLDQGMVGHKRRKPTTLATSLESLLQLDGLRGSPRQDPNEDLRREHLPLEQRIKQSKQWAAWAPGLKHAIMLAMKQHLQHVDFQLSPRQASSEPSPLQPNDDAAQVQQPAQVNVVCKGKDHLALWREHYLNDHLPARRDCAQCVRAQARSKPHRRIVHPEAYTLSLDLSGRMSPGDDQQVKACKYIMVGTYTYPVDRNGRSIPEVPGQADDEDIPLPPPGEGDEIPGEDGADGVAVLQNPPAVEVADDPLAEQPEEVDEALGDEAPCIKAAQSMHGTWHKLVQESEGFSMKQLTFVEVVKSRHVKHILPAVSKIYARLRSLGLPLYRLHTDRAKEFVSEQMRAWALERHLVSTMTPGSSFKTNGRVEGEMNTVKKSIRTLVSSGVATLQQWPLVARHIGERRLRAQLHGLGWPVGRLIRFGAKAYAMRKSWQGSYDQWRDVREEVKVLGPDIHSSLTSTGYYVQSITTGRKFYTDDVVIPALDQPTAEDQVLYLPERPPVPAPRRLRAKTSVPAISMCNIEGEEIILKRFGQMFEPLPPRGPYKPPYYETDAHDDGSSDSWTLDATSDEDYVSEASSGRELGGYQKGKAPNSRCGGSSPAALSQNLQQGAASSHEAPQPLSQRLPALQRLHHNITDYIKDELYLVDGSDPNQAHWLPVLNDAIQVRVALENQMLDLVANEPQPENTEFLVTKTMSNREVWENLPAWEASIRAEHDQLVGQKQAVRQISRAALQELAEKTNLPIELLPAKMVHTRKAPDGKYRSRAVICGNYSQEDPGSNNYAGGADAVQCRSLVRISASYGWELSGTDIKVAFLHAPKRDVTRITACEVPTVFKRLGLANDDDVWVVEKALYGLPSSPRDWGVHRDDTIPSLRWNRTVDNIERSGRFVASGDDNLWRLIEIEKHSGKEHWVGLMSVYVDDILIGAEAGAKDGAMKALADTWSISAVETATASTPLRFCGFEIRKDAGGDGFHIAQTMYEKEILAKWNVTGKSAFPAFKISEEDEMSREFDQNELREAQALTGALLWLSTRTRPDLVFRVSTMSRLVARNPIRAVEVGRALLAYINGNPGGLHYPREVPHGPWGARKQLKVARHAKLLEVFSDIAYGAGSNHKSIQGLVMFLGGCPIAWQFVTHSTAEAELVAMCESLLSGRATEAMLCAMLGEDINQNTLERVIYGDNSAAIGLAHGSTATSWRTRHLRIRANVLREALDESSPAPGGQWKLLHLNGKELVSDGCTKPLQGQAFFKFLEDLGLQSWKSSSEDAAVEPRATYDQAGCGEGVIATAMKAVAVGSLLISGVNAQEDDIEDQDSDFTPILIAGSLLAAVGAVYLGRLAHSAAHGCLKRLRVPTEDAGERERASEAPEPDIKMMSCALCHGRQCPDRPFESRTPLPSSGSSNEAGEGAPPLTPLRQSGLQHGAAPKSSMRSSGSSSANIAVAKRKTSSSKVSVAVSSSSDGATEVSVATSSAEPAAAATSLSVTGQSGIAASEAAGVQANEIRNPWNLFQHEHRNLGLSVKQLSKLYHREKAKRQ